MWKVKGERGERMGGKREGIDRQKKERKEEEGKGWEGPFIKKGVGRGRTLMQMQIKHVGLMNKMQTVPLLPPVSVHIQATEAYAN